MSTGSAVNLVAILTPKPEHKDDVIKAMKEMVDAVIKEEPDVMQYEVCLQDDNDDVIVIEKYKDAAVYENHGKTSHIATLFKTISEGQWLAAPPQLRKCKHEFGMVSR